MNIYFDKNFKKMVKYVYDKNIYRENMVINCNLIYGYEKERKYKQLKNHINSTKWGHDVTKKNQYILNNIYKDIVIHHRVSLQQYYTFGILNLLFAFKHRILKNFDCELYLEKEFIKFSMKKMLLLMCKNMYVKNKKNADILNTVVLFENYI